MGLDLPWFGALPARHPHPSTGLIPWSVMNPETGFNGEHFGRWIIMGQEPVEWQDHVLVNHIYCSFPGTDDGMYLAKRAVQDMNNWPSEIGRDGKRQGRYLVKMEHYRYPYASEL